MSGVGKTTKKTTRELRLEAALRENLKRRKAQVRSRASAGGIDAESVAKEHALQDTLHDPKA
jgi:hypothetical protein